ncbi:hypothetical protein SCHPADRAFT_687916 [Schizopora paradoxa]|uniref:Uncharacterized protein n=1 Tax=Schizopora paradoxa TaxID=27342 RepID=A0A0H2R595_9AGAM|nr:hypothetical protein SCHPADRAFT_687916 [Schizopora paradoxa]
MSQNINKGRYERIIKHEEVGSHEANVFAPRSSTFGPRFQMGLLLLFGAIFASLHHFLYRFLDRQPVDNILFSIHGFPITSQSVSNIAGNTIAYITRAVLSAGIGVVFIQILWLKLRKGQFSVRQIDALVACRGEPFAPSALPSWSHAFGLATVAAMATLMAFISIIAPGSLRIESSEFSFSKPCPVRTVSLPTSNIAAYDTNSSDGGLLFMGAQAGLMVLTGQVLMGGAALQAANPCPGACRYTIEFNAPFANCNPVDSSFDFSVWLPPPENDTSPVRLWTARTSATAGLWVVAATRDLSTNSQSAVNCTAYNATYHAVVTHTNTSISTIDVFQTDVHDQLNFLFDSSLLSEDRTAMQYNAIICAFADILIGTINYNPTVQEFQNNDNLFVAYSPSFAGSMATPWSSPPDLKTILPSLMQNISVSLLNGQLSQEQNSTTAPFDTMCYYTSSAYHYNEIRLLATYGTALVITAVCMVFGYYAVHSNGREESVSFSRILGSILNKSLFDDRHELSRSSKLTADGSDEGQLRLVHTTYG